MRVLQQPVNEFTDFDNQENVPNVDTLKMTLFDVESKSSQIWSKLRRNENSQIQIGDVRCITLQAKSVEIHCQRTFDRGVCL